jgi:hypothetical protein
MSCTEKQVGSVFTSQNFGSLVIARLQSTGSVGQAHGVLTMFGIGFWEMIILGIIGLIVLVGCITAVVAALAASASTRSRGPDERGR